MSFLSGSQAQRWTMSEPLELCERDFERFSRLVYQQAGINLHQGKKELLRARLAKRIRDLGYRSFAQYYRHVMEDESGQEIVQMLDCIATNLTRFFREEAHFKFLEEVVYPEFRKALDTTGEPPVLRVWSSACSTGEEPYSIAMHAKSHLDQEVCVLATDISTRALDLARKGIYPLERLTDVPPNMVKLHFLRGHGPREGWVRLKPQIRACVRFARHNLLDPPPVEEQMHVVFCRNVLIYFDRATQRRVIENVARSLVKGGYLLVGHAESLNGCVPSLKYVKPAVYRKL